mgnify:CR=1 FL=1|tara:strand:- start:758 stop:871 length:114 start_codon:yes stop_codon:yes gene_type:complete
MRILKSKLGAGNQDGRVFNVLGEGVFHHPNHANDLGA